MHKGSHSHPVVTISEGQLQGKRASTSSGTHYYAFRGIPFARPPVGELRFMPPQPPEPWDGVRDASYERSICPQPKLKAGSMPSSLGEVFELVRALPQIHRFVKVFSKQSEDCLYLNVLTPHVPEKNSLSASYPVLFWIHGGGFFMGCGNEVFGCMDQMLDRGVVVVTINYRLGPFGFLSLDTEGAPGNAGLKDQVQALRWVQRNIAQFGGDPQRVTVYGVSAGGASTHLLTVSPLARGLFHGAIAGSGVALCDWAVTTNNVRRARAFAKHFDILAESPEEIASALKRLSAEDIVKALPKFLIEYSEETVTSALYFAPSLERPGPGAFLWEMPEAVLREGRQAPVPLIAGVALNEGALWYMLTPAISLEDLNEDCQKLMPRDLYDALPEEDRKPVGRKIVEFYCGERGLSKDTEAAFIDMYGDIAFVVKFLLTCREHAATSPAPVYMYRFVFDGKLGGSKMFMKGHPAKGPGHSDELGYVAPMQVMPPPRLRPEAPEKKVRDMLSDVLTSFIKTGRPSCPDSPWNPVTYESMDYLEMGEEFRMKRDKFGHRLQFWDDLYKTYLNKPIFVSPDDNFF